MGLNKLTAWENVNHKKAIPIMLRTSLLTAIGTWLCVK
jgi:hypothetical protein